MDRHFCWCLEKFSGTENGGDPGSSPGRSINKVKFELRVGGMELRDVKIPNADLKYMLCPELENSIKIF